MARPRGLIFPKPLPKPCMTSRDASPNAAPGRKTAKTTAATAALIGAGDVDNRAIYTRSTPIVAYFMLPVLPGGR
jgi:hypothetical protein